MSNFAYSAVDGAGKTISGEIASADKRAATQQLAQTGLRVYDLTEMAGPSGSVPAAPSGAAAPTRAVTAQNTQLVLSELATLLLAGVPLADAVNNLQQGHANSALGDAMDGIYRSLRGGATFSDSLANSQLALPAYVAQLVRAGEETGKLPQSLHSASNQMEADAHFRRETRNALTYPAVLVASGLVATMVVFVFVVPKFANILNNPKVDLPLLSRWVLQTGLWVVQNKLAVAISAFAAVATLVWGFSSAAVRAQGWELASSLPGLRRWVSSIETSRWASMLSVLLEHRVPMLDALGHASRSLTGRAWQHRASLVSNDVRNGKTLAQAIQAHKFLDQIGVNLVRVGESSGRLAQTVASLAQMQRTQSEQRMKQFLILLEPIAVLLISVLLGGIMISIMVAITSMTTAV